MKKILISLGILSLLLITMGLTACVQEKVTCNSPYIKVGTSCCLDKDNNSVCDKQESVSPNTTIEGGKKEVFNCSSCDPIVVEREVVKEVKKYVCEKDNRVVNNIDECKHPADNISYNPIKTNENGTSIKDFKVRPACMDGYNAGEIHYLTGTLPNEVIIQIKEGPNKPWKKVYTYDLGDNEKYFYFSLCDVGSCSTNVDFQLEKNKKYLMRALFDFEKVYGETQISNEWVVDATREGNFSTKLC